MAPSLRVELVGLSAFWLPPNMTALPQLQAAVHLIYWVQLTSIIIALSMTLTMCQAPF